MRLVTFKEIKGNEISACNISDSQGRLLLTSGSRIKLSYLNKLEEQGLSSIYIEDKISEGIIAEGIICEETKQLAKIIIENEMKRFLKSKEIDSETIKKVSSVLVNEILLNRIELINLKDIKLKDEYIFSHSINVCAITIFICKKMGFEHSKIHGIASGALLHDFGKLLIPKEILSKQGKLTNEEFSEMKKHPKYGYEAIKDDALITPTTKVIVYMHHERIDGSGYPNGLMGSKIHDSAKLCSICNTFDSMTSDKPYRKAYTISDTVEYLYSTAGIYYEKNYIHEFLKYTPIYPVGMIVLLSNSIVGVIVKNNIESLIRPVVRLLYNPHSRIKYVNREVNLMEELTLKIEREIIFNRDEYESI